MAEESSRSNEISGDKQLSLQSLAPSHTVMKADLQHCYENSYVNHTGARRSLATKGRKTFHWLQQKMPFGKENTWENSRHSQRE